jgi:hypothetical protein
VTLLCARVARANIRCFTVPAVYRPLAPCEGESSSILKGGDYVKFIIATLTTFAVTATGIVPVLANCCP